MLFAYLCRVAVKRSETDYGIVGQVDELREGKRAQIDASGRCVFVIYRLICCVLLEWLEYRTVVYRIGLVEYLLGYEAKIIVADDLFAAIEIANEIAPEHLELCVDEPFDYLDKVKHAGSVFMGRYCPEALGDYFAGPNHTLPTSGTARFSSPLSVDDFVKKTQFTYYTKEALETCADKIAYFANKEGLDAHAKSATVRFDEE